MVIKTNYDFLNRVNLPDYGNGEATRKASQPKIPEAEETRSLQPSSTRKVLSLPELAMLHMLFGTEKPQEMKVYGKSQLQQIHKGQLIDLIG